MKGGGTVGTAEAGRASEEVEESLEELMAMRIVAAARQPRWAAAAKRRGGG
jgi:hypothetical protein